MSKRLQLTVRDSEYREIRRAARLRHMSLAAWVQEAVDWALGREPSQSVDRKLAVIRAGARHAYPASDIAKMLEETEKGYRQTE